MIKARFPNCGLALALLLMAAGGAFGEDIQNAPHNVPRFHQVAPGIYRGGQPKAEGFEWLKRQGVKTIINLRMEHDERREIEALGLNYVYIPMDARDEVPMSTLRMFLDTLSDPDRQPVFVHCQRGADRTGFMVGVYRVAREGWSAKKAYSEARDIGMRWWYRGLKRQLYEYAEQIHGSGKESAGE